MKLNPMASYPSYDQPHSESRWNFPPYDDQFGYPHVAGRHFENGVSCGAIFEARQLPSDDSIDTI